jgi:hypothetical protein
VSSYLLEDGACSLCEARVRDVDDRFNSILSHVHYAMREATRVFDEGDIEGDNVTRRQFLVSLAAMYKDFLEASYRLLDAEKVVEMRACGHKRPV